MHRRPTTTARRAVTLLEVALAMGLLVVLSSMTYWFYASALGVRSVETERARKLRLARVVLDGIVREIRQSSAISAGGRIGLRGEPEQIWLSTLRVPRKDLTPRRSSSDAPPEAQTDLVKVEYKIARHPEVLDDDGYERALGLARVELGIPLRDSAETGAAFEGERKVFGATEGAGSETEALPEDELVPLEDADQDVSLGPDIELSELYAPEIRFLRFCYFDGSTWWNDWKVEGESPLPQLVEVTVGFEGHPPFGEDSGTRDDVEFCECKNEDPTNCDRLDPDQFSTVVRIPLADPLFRSRITRETQALMEEAGTGEEAGAEGEVLP